MTAESAAAENPAKEGEEPSIEEILASIRKIISDEPGAEETEAQVPVNDMPPPPEPNEPKPEPAIKIDNNDADDILDLSAFADESETTDDASEPGILAELAQFADDANVTQTDTDDDAPKGDIAMDAEQEEETNGINLDMEDSDMQIDDTDTMNIDDIMASAALSPNMASDLPSAPMDETPKEKLVSESSAAVTTAALAKLASAADHKPSGTQLWVGARTIEQVVEDLMRPMLKEWLDQNLPTLVERLVEKELARMARRATE